MSTHSSRLQHAHKDLREKWDIARETWTDQVARDFEKNQQADALLTSLFQPIERLFLILQRVGDNRRPIRQEWD